ncbi:MAG: hypothetical protein HC888_03455 [Candidatus Competibacteraceae bacterium]|nr:hypothetical protein [Candidatus Competibacteraceae bacterium]
MVPGGVQACRNNPSTAGIPSPGDHMSASPSPLNAAHRQWCSRPADERFWNLQDMHDHCKAIQERSSETRMGIDALRVAATPDDDLMLTRGGGKLGFTNWSFGQLCRVVGAPAGYLTDLPAPSPPPV